MSRATAILLLAISLGFVAIGVWLASVSAGDDRLIGLVCAVFFGACAVVAVGQLLPRRTAVTDADGVTLIQPDRVQMATLFIGAAGFAAACPFIALLAAADGEIMKALIVWGGTVFFGACALIGLWRLIRARPLLRLDSEGVTNLALKGWTAPWRAIRGLLILEVRGQDFIALDVDPATGIEGGALQRVNRAFGFPPFTIGPQGTAMGFEAFLELVQSYWTRHRGW
jgi:hypothetical protein